MKLSTFYLSVFDVNQHLIQNDSDYICIFKNQCSCEACYVIHKKRFHPGNDLLSVIYRTLFKVNLPQPGPPMPFPYCLAISQYQPESTYDRPEPLSQLRTQSTERRRILAQDESDR